MSDRRVLNLGAGTQSSVLLVMCDRGELPPVELAVFADTGDEPREVYEHLNWLEKQVRTPIVRVTAGDMVKESLVYQAEHKGVDGRYASLPLYTPTGMQPRQCTKYYKVIPIARYIRKHVLRLGVRQPVPKGTKVVQSFGISFDERERMAKPRVQFVEHEYPFVDMRLRRYKVIEIARHWFPDHEFPRSACKRCPYRKDDEFLSLTPEEFEEVCEYDDAIRDLGPVPSYVHRSRIPLRQVRLGAESMFDGVRQNECEGMCGV
jgi:hypothetical protein